MLRGALIVSQRRPVQCSRRPGFPLVTDQVPTHTLWPELTASPGRKALLTRGKPGARCHPEPVQR